MEDIIGNIVKLKNPGLNEIGLIYKIVNVNEITKRVYIESLNTSVKTQELVSINDIVKI